VYAQYLETGDGFAKDLAGAEAIYRSRGGGNPGRRVPPRRFPAVAQSVRRGGSLVPPRVRPPPPDGFFFAGYGSGAGAGDAGNVRAQYDYALLLEESGTDRAAVEKYYKLASDAGLPNAMCNNAAFLSATDAATSLRLFREAPGGGTAR
jgi:hypothetical protein